MGSHLPINIMLCPSLSLLLFTIAFVKCQGPPNPPPDAITCPYPAASSIAPCECLADPETFRVYLNCQWNMGQDNDADAEKFATVLAQFDSYTQIYVLHMSCDQCFNHELDALLNEYTTGRFEFEYVTLEHFDTSTLTEDAVQFSDTALVGSRDSLRYIKVYPYHYFSPSLQLLAGMTNLEELYLQRLDTSQQGLPSFSSLTNLRLLSLLDGSLGTVAASNFAGLSGLNALFLDRCEINALESGSFSNLPSLTQLSISGNNITHIPEGVFSNLPSLLILNMGDSQIQTIDDSFEGANPNIQILLYDNGITTLPEKTWRPLVESMLNTPLSQVRASVLKDLS